MALIYLPHKVVAEVSKDKEPIGRVCAEFNWFESQLMSDSNEVRFKWFWLSVDLKFNWFGCQLIWDSNDLVVNRCVLQMRLSVDLKFNWFGCQLIWDSIDLVVNRFEIQMSRLSIDLRFEWFGCQMIWGSSDLVVSRWVIQMILSNEAFLRDFLQNWNFEDQKPSISARLPSKLKLWSLKTKLFCETSFNFEAPKRSILARLPSKLKLWSSKNKAFLRDFLQKWNFEAPKRSISARFPSKLKLWSSKNKAFLRDFLQKWNFEAPKRSISARVPSKMKRWSSKTKLFGETSFKNDMSTRHLTSELQYVAAIFNWMLQKYCACHEKVEPRHTKSCNCHAKWSLQSNTSVTWNLQPFHGFWVGGFKHRHHKARNHCACHAKRIVSDPLQIPTTPTNVFATLTNSCACHVFCNVSKSLRLPRETHFQPQKTSRALVF